MYDLKRDINIHFFIYIYLQLSRLQIDTEDIPAKNMFDNLLKLYMKSVYSEDIKYKTCLSYFQLLLVPCVF